MDPFQVSFNSLPDKVTLWLVDNPTDFCCPYQVKVFSKFGVRHRRRHQGCDLPLKTGDPIRAAFAGKVRISEYSRGYGNLVVIRHENGLETAYGHLSKREVEVGDWVSAGDEIGLGGSTGRATGPHLHFETRYQGYAFDPEWLIDFETGTLRSGVFTLKKKYLSENSNYVPESEDVEEEILLAEAEDREEAARKAAEEAAKQYHTIKSGDTLGALAVRYHTTVRQLCAWNNIKQTTTLRIGQRLRVK
jgi:murein DD-endopeptidase MepM/ murein hydrolase activator NlpD